MSEINFDDQRMMENSFNQTEMQQNRIITAMQDAAYKIGLNRGNIQSEINVRRVQTRIVEIESDLRRSFAGNHAPIDLKGELRGLQFLLGEK